MNGRYVTDAEGNPIEEPDLLTWAAWFENTDNRRVRQDKLPSGTKVSTVFLGLDHSFDEGEPVLWETMIFGGPLDEFQDRYTSREDAIRGHEEALRKAQEAEARP